MLISWIEKKRVLCGVAKIAGRDHVDSAADARTLDGGDNRQPTLLEGVEGLLRAQCGVTKLRACPAAVSAADAAGRLFEAAEHSEVHARAEVPADR